MNDKLDPNLERAFEDLKRVPARDPQAAARGRARFLTEAAELQAVSGRAKARQTGWNIRPQKERLAMNALISILIVFMLLLGGGATTVYAAQDDLPGQALYPLKTWSEDVRLQLTADPEQEIDLLMDFAQRRVEEMLALTAQGLTPPAEVQVRLEAHLGQALQIAAGLDDTAMQAAMQRIHTALQNDLQIMLQAGGDASANLIQARQTIETRLRLVESGQADPQGFRQTVRQEQRLQQGQTATPTTGHGDQDGQGGPARTPVPPQTPGGPRQPEQTPHPTAQPAPRGTPGGQGRGGPRP